MKKVLYAIGSLVVAAIGLVVVQDKLVYREYLQHSASVKQSAGAWDNQPVSEKDMDKLPEPVKRYLRYSGVVGKKRLSYIHLLHAGMFKPGQDKSWCRINGEYFITTKTLSFTWYGKIFMAPGLSVVACDSYFQGQGRMLVKLLSTFVIADAQDQSVSASAFGRCIAELAAMAPNFYLDDKITWIKSDARSATFSYADSGMTAQAEVYFQVDGTLDRIELARYFDRGQGQSTPEKFVGQASGVFESNGYRIPAELKGYWMLKEGKFEYVDFQITKMEFE